MSCQTSNCITSFTLVLTPIDPIEGLSKLLTETLSFLPIDEILSFLIAFSCEREKFIGRIKKIKKQYLKVFFTKKLRINNLFN